MQLQPSIEAQPSNANAPIPTATPDKAGAAADARADRERLRARQISQLYGNISLGLVGSIGSAMLVALLVLYYVDPHSLALWLTAILLTTCARYALSIVHRRASDAKRLSRLWLFGFSLTLALTGLAWGVAVHLFHQPGQLVVVAVLGLSIAGLVAGAIAAYSSYYPSIIAFALPATLPFIYYLLQGPADERLLAATLAIFTLVMLGVGYKINRLADSDIRREIENQKLIDELTRQKHDIAAFNSRLEASVTERTRKLEQQIAVRAQIESALRDSEARFRQIFEHTGISMLVTDLLGRVLDANSRACSTFGYTESQFLGKDLLGITHPDDHHLARHELVVLASGEKTHGEFECRFLSAKGEVLCGMVNLTATADSRTDDHYLISAIQDITEAKQMAQQVSFQANHDALTGLANRHYFEQELQRLYDSARDTNRQHLLAYLDLDRFKLVNDACGHLAGDELLRQLGLLLKKESRDMDTVARLGGDEFGLLLENTHYETGMAVIGKLTRAIEQFEFHWLDRRFSLGVSAGVVAINRNAGTPTDLLRNADSACYTAKETGRHRIQIYDDHDAALVERKGQMRWINRIEQALQEDRFVLYAQAIHSLRGSDAGMHCEILLRMLGDDGELIPPGEFLPAAERYGLCPRLDAWVLRTVYHTLEDSSSALDRITLCSINLSGQSLNDEVLIDQVNTCAREHEAMVGKVCFEITETSAITNLTRVRQMMLELRAIGCRFALDDFGTGFSSYAYLNDFPVDFLKIDGQFVRDIDRNPVHRAMVRSINEIGHLMGKKTVAEYVENQAVLGQLQQIGVDYAQGWHIGKPKPLADFLRSVRPLQRA